MECVTNEWETKSVWTSITNCTMATTGIWTMCTVWICGGFFKVLSRLTSNWSTTLYPTSRNCLQINNNPAFNCWTSCWSTRLLTCFTIIMKYKKKTATHECNIVRTHCDIVHLENCNFHTNYFWYSFQPHQRFKIGSGPPPSSTAEKYGASWGCLGHHTSSVNFSMRPVASAVALTWESQNFTNGVL